MLLLAIGPKLLRVFKSVVSAACIVGVVLSRYAPSLECICICFVCAALSAFLDCREFGARILGVVDKVTNRTNPELVERAFRGLHRKILLGLFCSLAVATLSIFMIFSYQEQMTRMWLVLLLYFSAYGFWAALVGQALLIRVMKRLTLGTGRP